MLVILASSLTKLFITSSKRLVIIDEETLEHGLHLCVFVVVAHGFDLVSEIPGVKVRSLKAGYGWLLWA
jgi:hypothetical protein